MSYTISKDTAKELISERLAYAVTVGWINSWQQEALEQFLFDTVDSTDTWKDFKPHELVDNAVINEYRAIKPDDLWCYKHCKIIATYDLADGKYHIMQMRPE